MQKFSFVAFFLVFLLMLPVFAAETLLDHEVVLDKEQRLLPWCSFDRILHGSIAYLIDCPTHRTRFGQDPWYLVTSKLNDDGTFRANQNNQGSNAYFAVETLARYYAYSGDKQASAPVRCLLDRILEFHTPKKWDWGNVPRTQDDTPDGVYRDRWGAADKICMVGAAYIRFYQLTGEEKYWTAAQDIARTVVKHIRKGDATHSPLPFRVQLKTGKILDEYTSSMVMPVIFFDRLIAMGDRGEKGKYPEVRDALWQWVMEYPMQNNVWSGYYEDVRPEYDNLNQQVPMETARYMLQHIDADPRFRNDVPALIAWVKKRFGQQERYGATSICEQDICFKEMSSHTARYASVVAGWYALTGEQAVHEEARAALALCSYSTFSKYSKGERSLNYVGVGYLNPWFSDSYFDFLSHLLDGMACLPELAPADQDHMLSSSDTVVTVDYQPGKICYTTHGRHGKELFRITFKPNEVWADSVLLPPSQWSFGDYRGVSNILRIERKDCRNITIAQQKKPE